MANRTKVYRLVTGKLDVRDGEYASESDECARNINLHGTLLSDVQSFFFFFNIYDFIATKS